MIYNNSMICLKLQIKKDPLISHNQKINYFINASKNYLNIYLSKNKKDNIVKLKHLIFVQKGLLKIKLVNLLKIIQKMEAIPKNLISSHLLSKMKTKSN